MNEIKDINNIVGSHRINGDLNTKYSFYDVIKDGEDAILTTFKVIETFLEMSIGLEYTRALPKNFFKNIFERCDSKRKFDVNSFDDDDKNFYRCEYTNKIIKLNRSLYYLLEKYSSLFYPRDNKVDDVINTKEKRYTVNVSNLVDNPNLVKNREIKYKVFPTVDEYISCNKLHEKAIEDIEFILDELGEIATLNVFVNESENSFMRFNYRILRKMKGDSTFKYTRSIINHSAFEFAAEGYPYNTNHDRLYSVRDVPPTVGNKFVLHDLYTNNVSAILNFFGDLTFDSTLGGERIDNLAFETKVLSNAYGIVIALAALSAEKVLNDHYLNDSLMSTKPLNELRSFR